MKFLKWVFWFVFGISGFLMLCWVMGAAVAMFFHGLFTTIQDILPK